MTEPDYAQVDMSKKKRNRRPVTDEYSQVDKSKKSKKPRKVDIVANSPRIVHGSNSSLSLCLRIAITAAKKQNKITSY